MVTTTTVTVMIERQHLAQLNNLGVAWMEQGDFLQSFHLFREALVSSIAMGEAEAHHQPSPSDPAPLLLSNTTSTSHCSSLPFSSYPLCVSRAVTTDHAKTSHLADPFKRGDAGSDPLAVHHFHAQGFLIEASSVSSSSSCSSSLQQQQQQQPQPQQEQLNLVDTTICSSIVIFNLALLHHIRAMACPTLRDQQPFTARATTLYKKCCILLFEPSSMEYLSWSSYSTATGAAAHSPMLDILRMAVLTNLAHLEFELVLDYDKSRFYQDQLVRYVHSMGPSLQLRYPEEPALVAQYMELQRANYLVNLIVLRRPRVAHAA